MTDRRMVCTVLRIVLVLVCVTPAVWSAEESVSDPYDLETWRASVCDGSLQPFSFDVGDRPARLRLLSSTDSLADGWHKTVVKYAEGLQPLEVALTCHFAPEFEMVRLVLTLQALGDLTAHVRNVQLLDVFSAGAPESVDPLIGQYSNLNILDAVEAAAKANAARPPRLHGLTGGFAAHRMPPDSSKPWSVTLDASLYHSEVTFQLDSGGWGRSSNFQTPLWVFAESDRGLWFGPEWTGDWDMSVRRGHEGTWIKVGMPTFDFTMYKGESFELPTAAFGPYTGGAEDGFNHLRAMIHRHYLPTIDGKKPTPRVYWQGYGAHPNYHTEEFLYQEVDRAAEIGCEVFCLDGAWNVVPGDPKWFLLVGDWDNEGRFPGGLAKFGKYVRSKGMKFGLWMEPRCGIETEINKERNSLFYPGAGGLMDLTQPEVQDLLIGVFEKFINEYGADWIWVDYNVDPRNPRAKGVLNPVANGWDTLEKPGRKGLMELGFYQGWYRCVDTILKKYPDVWFESCASGGRIMDLGQLRRSHSVWVNDHHVDDDPNRNLRGGLNRLLPAVVIQNSIFLTPGVLAKPQESVDLGGSHRFLTYFGGDFGFGQGLPFWKQKDIDAAARHAVIYKKYRHYLEKDFYHLFPFPQTKDAWDGWQYHDPKSNSGIVLVFRLEDSKRDGEVVSLRAIADPSKYTWSRVAGQADVDATAKALSVRMAAPHAVLLHYQMK